MVKNMETKIKMTQDTPFNGLTISLKPDDIATKMDLDKLEEQLEKNFDLKISIITKTLEAIPNETHISIQNAFEKDNNKRNENIKFIFGSLIFGVINILISIYV